MKSQTKRRCSLGFAASLLAGFASPVFAADPSQGETIVKRWCAGCHLVATGQKSSTEATPFSVIARRPDFDATKIAFFLLDPHPKMPNMQLTRAEATDIAAYIGTLK